MKDGDKTKEELLKELKLLREERGKRVSKNIFEYKEAEQALKESEEKYRTVFENSGTAMIIIEEDKIISMVNTQSEKMYGYSKEEIENKMKWTDFVIPEDLERMKKYHIARRKAGGKAPTEYEFRLIDKKGNVKNIFLKIGMIPNTRKSVASLMDITEKKKVEKEWKSLVKKEQQQRLKAEALAKAILILTSKLSLSEVLKEVLRQAKQLVPYSAYNISLIKERKLYNIHSVGYDKYGTGEFVNNFKYPVDKIPLEKEVTKTAKPLLVSDTHQEPRWIIFKETSWVRSCLLMPICLDNKVIGLLNLDNDTPGKFVKDDIKKLQPLVNAAAVALGNAQLFEEEQKDIDKRKKAEERLKKTMDAAIDTMSRIIEAKDPYTAGHQQRVSQLTTAIAKELNLSPDKVEGIRIASLIHDIGKIGLPTEILSKPTRLTDIEFSLIKGHSQIGYDILKPIDFSYPIANIVLQHHERLNASGYPNHLRGDEILLEAKIIGVADVVEAMSSFRPYRPALGVDKALEEISKNKGILYEPIVVDACIKLFKEKGFKFESQQHSTPW